MGSSQSQPQDNEQSNRTSKASSGATSISEQIKKLYLNFSVSSSSVKILAHKFFENLPTNLSEAEIADENFKNFLSQSCPKLKIFNELLYLMFKGFTFCSELESYQASTKGVLKFEKLVEGISVFIQKHPTIKGSTREMTIITALAYGYQSQQDNFDCEKEPEITANSFSLLINGILNCADFISKRQLFLEKELMKADEFTAYLFCLEDSDNLDEKLAKSVYFIQSILSSNIPLWSIVIDDYLNGLLDAIVQANVKTSTPLIVSEILKFNRDYLPHLDATSLILKNKELAFVALSVANLIKPHSQRESISYRWSWSQLYLASEHGFSMNRFETHVFKYPGPTLMVLHCSSAQTDEDIILGAFVDQPWKNSKTAWGGPSIRVFQLSPIFETFIPFDCNDNSSTPSVPSVLFHSSQGIGIGPTLNPSNLSASRRRSTSNPIPFFFHIDSSLQFLSINKDCLKMSTNPPFKPSTHSNYHNDQTLRNKLDIVEIEVYGLASKPDEALKIQQSEWKFDNEDAQRRQKINALSNPHDPMNRQLLVMAGVLEDDTEAQSNHRAQ